MLITATSRSSAARSAHPTHRVGAFISESGVRRVYQFKKQDDNSLTLDTLVRQLSSAGWVACDRFRPGDVKPT